MIKQYFTPIVICWAGFVSIMMFKSVIVNENFPWTMYRVLQEKPATKYILYWNKFFSRNDFGFGIGRSPFQKFNCPVSDCFITHNKSFTSIDNFDAIIFHGPEYKPSENNLPKIRSPNQLYAYFSMECPEMWRAFQGHNRFFNVTMSYRLDSDILVPYFGIYNNKGDWVAPSFQPVWKAPNHNPEYLKKYLHIFERKTKPVAWFVSHCGYTHNHRMDYVRELQKYISVDVYGKCGSLKCPKNMTDECHEKLKNDYFFYLSFENSNCVDYVTEKILVPLTHEVIPVTLNGADMRTVLPPFSYLNAKKFTPAELADKIKSLMNNSLEYVKYFWWLDYYSTQSSHLIPHPFCTLCQMAHEKDRKPKFYDNFVEWWHGSIGNPMCNPRNDVLDCNGGRCTGSRKGT